MRKQDTAALNTHALVARVGELGIKQYWLARKLDVTTRTVNRWMTGKVKRISRDNLDRMVEVLKTSHEELTTADEGDVYATRSEQTKAANLLVMRETESLFIASQRFEAYEQLLKATLHPDLTLQQLAVMYNQLLIVSAMQRKFDDARLMAERCIDYASRCGDVPHEIAARTGRAIVDAEQGLLKDARKKLELLLDMQESIGATTRQRCNTLLNLGTVYRFLGEMKRAAAMVNLTIEYHSQHGRSEFCSVAYKSAGLLARDTGKYAEALPYFEVAGSLLDPQTHTRELAEINVHELETRSLMGEISVVAALDPLLQRLRSFTYFGENQFLAAAGIYRRAGQFDKAEAVINEGLSAASTRRYERGLLLQELARVANLKCDTKSVGRCFAEANEIFKACGIVKRMTDDPAIEVGDQFRQQMARTKLLWIPVSVLPAQANA